MPPEAIDALYWASSAMMGATRDEVAVVIGAGSGIGRATAIGAGHADCEIVRRTLYRAMRFVIINEPQNVDST